jgi:hypothetical protein
MKLRSYSYVAGSRKELAVLVKGYSHDTVCGKECLLNTVTVMHVNINVQYALVETQELEDRQDNVVDIAKPRRLGFLCVMQAAAPVDADVRLATIELSSGSYKRRREVM